MNAGLLANVLGPDGLIVVIVVGVVLVFGGARIPKLARGLGSASHEFKRGLAEGDRDASTSASASAPGSPSN
ncbi:MAG TPA: twin-arginine translocase TatA/TatE family subunit [Acidimicrobiales bacterium]|nr:twin-arginine translocase TatA/TatE family subunit [Acidimicrobiales bacterium]